MFSIRVYFLCPLTLLRGRAPAPVWLLLPHWLLLQLLLCLLRLPLPLLLLLLLCSCSCSCHCFCLLLLCRKPSQELKAQARLRSPPPIASGDCPVELKGCSGMQHAPWQHEPCCQGASCIPEQPASIIANATKDAVFQLEGLQSSLSRRGSLGTALCREHGGGPWDSLVLSPATCHPVACRSPGQRRAQCEMGKICNDHGCEELSSRPTSGPKVNNTLL